MDASRSRGGGASAPSQMSGAGQYLSGLPSRGLFSSIVPSSNLGGIRLYVSDHDTSPPAEQYIKTDNMNALIRGLQIKNQKSERPSDNKGKRLAAKALESTHVTKKANMARASKTSQQEGSSSSSRPLELNFQTMTVERLRALLKARGLQQKGRKEELIDRLNRES